VAEDFEEQHHKGGSNATGQKAIPADAPDQQPTHDHAGKIGVRLDLLTYCR